LPQTFSLSATSPAAAELAIEGLAPRRHTPTRPQDAKAVATLDVRERTRALLGLQPAVPENNPLVPLELSQAR
jgi:hypothetical protein